MQRYDSFRPTPFDHHLPIDGREHWIVAPVTQNRDSGCLDQSNFYSALMLLGGEQEDLVEVHRFGHWELGWYEIIIVHPSLREKVEAIVARLEDYPILDDKDLSEREYAAIDKAWSCMTLREKIEFATENGHSKFAARRHVFDCNSACGYAVYRLINR